MIRFTHLHVHSQYSVLDGQSAIPKLVDKALKDGMPGMALTDHGNMMGVKEYFNYINGLKGATKNKIAAAEEELAKLKDGTSENIKENSDIQFLINKQNKILELQRRIEKFVPIFGCEMYVAHNRMTEKNGRKDEGGWHLIVLAKNEKGYHNLIKLVSKSWTDGFYMRPRTDKEELERYKEGLIVSSACLGGEIPQKIMKESVEKAEEAALWFKKVFGDDYYLELQRHEVKNPQQLANRNTFIEQEKVNKVIIAMSEKLNIPLICTNDAHFVDEENAEAHDRLICLSTGKDLDDPRRMLYSKQEWFKTTEEMNEVFSDLPKALENTCKICDQIETYSINHGPIMPNFEIPEDFGTEESYKQRFSKEDLYKEFTEDENGAVVLSKEEGEEKIKKLGGYDKLYRIKLEADYLAKLTYEGAIEKYGDPLNEELSQRLKFELYVMKTMGFPGYFLIVQDYINAARDELNVSVGPGRGSAAGSAVAYCLGITLIDPIKYDLLFERFLNPDRISLPDIDVDFDDDGRAKVLQWVTDKYGADKVAHIITFGTMATKLAIKDVARVQKLPLAESNRLCKLIPDKLPEDKNGKTPKMNLSNAIAAIPELQQAEVSTNKILSDTIKYARMLEGNIRNTGVHACGVIICRDEISDWVPISTAKDKQTGEKLICTQYDGSVIEETGLIKMDFLGLKTLSIIKEALANIRLTTGEVIDIEKIDINDEKTYQLYSEGRTIGTFQFESPGMQKYLRELKPTTFEDLIAMNALYRPGPIQYIPNFIKRKHGIEPITYPLDCMEKYLKDTYGITVYQEQVMLLSRQIANFTRGESDTLRKAMGKKKLKLLAKLYPKFIKGGISNGHDPKVLEKIWEDWKSFASYAFNKSHATCYSWVAYQTAYLKANYPSQYMAGNMSRNMHNITEITKLMDECQAMGISTLGPDVNESQLKFGVNKKGDIRYGLAAIKGVGAGAAEAILEERNNNGEYKSIYDFVERVNLSACNKKCFENLALAGGFDSFNLKREAYFSSNKKGISFIEDLIRYGNRYKEDKATVQNSLFGDFEGVEIQKPIPSDDIKEWTDLDRLNKERDLIGIYLSSHPLDDYMVILTEVCNAHFTQLEDKEQLKDKSLKFAGIVTGVREGFTKTGKPYGAVDVEDYEGTGNFALFGDDWMRWKNYFILGNRIFLTATVEPRRYDNSIYDLRIASIEFLSDVKDQVIEKITIDLQLEDLNDEFALELLTFIENSPGKTRLLFNIFDRARHERALVESKLRKITVNKSFLDFLKGKEGFTYKIN